MLQLTQGRSTATEAEVISVDVLIVGAGISGIGVAYHLQDQMPEISFAIVEARADFGGTWRIHNYPGIRSDSDLYTFGYRFKPWAGKPVADGQSILSYVGEVLDENDLRRKIAFNSKVMAADWVSGPGVWNVSVRNTQTDQDIVYRAKFLWMCQGYYEPSQGYTPDWPGFADYEGEVVHPQTWPKGLDYADKNVLVIGSGATAATLVPNMAETAGHITMLQRSPTYFWTGENRSKLADFLGKLHLPDSLTHKIVRWWILSFHRRVHAYSKKRPELVKRRLLDGVREHLPEGFDIDKHFSPSYRPWQQRLAYVPDADLFKAASAGKVSFVTDTIKTFTRDGVLTEGGEDLKADLIITATGFNLSVMGGILFSVDGEAFDFSQSYTYRGVMFSGMPNMTYMFGYLRTSWTMRVDLVADYILRLLKHMQKTGMDVCTPTLRDKDRNMAMNSWIPEEDFNPGYIKRSGHLMPKQGDHAPWTYVSDYYQERNILPKARFDDGALVFRKTKS